MRCKWPDQLGIAPSLRLLKLNVIIRKFNMGTLKFAELEKLLKSCAPDYV